MADPPAAPLSAQELWSRLRLIGRRIQRRDLVRALRQLNALAQKASAGANPVTMAFLRCLNGDAGFKQGRFAGAAAAYGLVRAAYPTHREGRLLMRGGMGELHSLLKLSDSTTAVDRATALVQVAAIPPPHFGPPADGSPLAVHSPLPEAPLVAARLAGLFRREGYAPEAAALLALAPPAEGHESARRERAESLLRAGDAAGAESLLLAMQQNAAAGNRTLTVRGWQLLLQVRRTLVKSLLLPPEIVAISAIQNHHLRSRIALAVVLAARQTGEPAWRLWLQTWQLTRFPTPAVIRLAASRLLLSEVRREAIDFAAMRALADEIMLNPKVRVNDYIAAARAALCAAFKGAGPATPLPMAHAAARKFGPSAKIRTLHSLAKTAREAGGTALAASLYRTVRQEASPHARRRSKATHALAVLSLNQGNYSHAAALSAELADDPLLSPEFRLQALDRQCTALRQLGRAEELEAARAKLDSLLPPNLPPSTLIRMARLSRLSGELGRGGIYAPLLERAIQATLQSVQEAAHPGPALTLLLELNRKLYWDFSEFSKVHSIWLHLGPDRREWLWTGRSAFWEYLSLVLRSCGKLGRHGEVKDLAAMAAADAPPEAIPFTATALGDGHREAGQWPAAFEAYAAAITAQPTHVESARAHYWLALRSRRMGQPEAARSSLDAIRRCFGSGVSLLWHWEHDARALLLLHQGDASAVASLSRYDLPFLSTQASAVLADEAAILAF